MVRRIRARLTYANVMSTIAVVFAVGGASAYAANHLPNNSVTSKTIKNGQVKTKDLHKGAVTEAKLANGAVTGSKLANGAVAGANLANGAVTSSKIGAQAVGTGQIAANAVTSGQIANGAVTTSQLANGAVNTIKIAPSSVTTGQIVNGAVTNAKLADGAVTTGKIADDAVTNSKLAANSVSGLVQIIDGTITGSDVIENSLTFGCTPTPDVISASGATGPFQVGGTGSCGFVITTGSHTWAQADAACAGTVPDSTLPSAAQLEQVAQAAGDQSVPTGTTGIWLDSPSGAGSVWTASVDGTAHVSAFASTTMTTSSSGPVVCVYQPASKQG